MRMQEIDLNRNMLLINLISNVVSTKSR